MPFISNGIYDFNDTVYSSKEMLNTSCIELSDAFITAITGNSTSDLNIFSQANAYNVYTDSYLWIGYTGFIYKNHLYQSYISSRSNKFTYIDFDLATKTVTKKTLTTTTSNNTGYWLIAGIFGNKVLLRGSYCRDLYILNLDTFSITKFGTLNFGSSGGPWIFNVYNENEIYYYEKPLAGPYGIEKMTLSGGITRTMISKACTIKVGNMFLGWVPNHGINSIQPVGSSTYNEYTLKMKKDYGTILDDASKITYDNRVIVKGRDEYNPTKECLYSIDDLTSDGTITISTYSSLNPIARVRNNAGTVNVIQTILKQTMNGINMNGLPQIIDLDNDAICLFTYAARSETISGTKYTVTPPTPYLFRIELPK